MNVYELVNSISDLQNISQNLAGFYALGKNIVGAGASVTSIGNDATPFRSELNGLGHSIDNITINVFASGTLSPSPGMGAGGLVGTNYGIINQSAADVSIEAVSGGVGG